MKEYEIEFEIQTFNTLVYFPNQQFSKQKDFKTLWFLYATKIKPVEVNVNFLHHLETSKNHTIFMFSGGIKENIDPQCVKELQYRRERKKFDVVNLKRQQFNHKTNYFKNKRT